MTTTQPLNKDSNLIWKEAGSKIRKQKILMIDLIVMGSLFTFLLCYFEPQYLFSKTITTGGDTGSHYYTAEYLKNYLLPRGKVSGWCQGNLSGFPMLQNYFPLPFLLMAILSWVIPLQISFKLVTVLGTFLLPPCTYLFFRLLKQPFPVPIIGAVFTLPFLFMEGNSMWGGNIPSTLAGTFCYSLGFTLTILWLGLLYRTLSEQKGSLGCSVLLAIIGLCHGYALVFSVFASIFFLFTRKGFGPNLKKLVQIHVMAFSLMAFWLVPLVVFLPYTTRFSILWIFFDWQQVAREIFPFILYPFMGMALMGVALAIFRRTRSPRGLPAGPWAYIWFAALCGLGLYGIGYRIGVVDIRFLPFFQFFLVIAGAMTFSLVSLPSRQSALIGVIVLLLTLLWTDKHETFIRSWIRSNYAGVEKTRLWESYSSVNHYLKGTSQDPRVAYEHSMLHRGAGTVRAFEALPLFSGRSTLEGVYIQASLCVPFIFYLQSEISQRASMPIPEYNYSRFNPEKGSEHLRLFNVRDLIVVEPETKKAMEMSDRFRSSYRNGPYEIFEVVDNSNRYIEPVRYKPVLAGKSGWRRMSYRWFRLGDLSVPLVFKDEVGEDDKGRFHIQNEPDVRRLPREYVDSSAPLKEVIREEEVLIEGASKGTPLLVKISYHPNWKVEGAEEIYLVSPAFMLIYPTSSRVRLYYGRTWPDYVGAAITGLALLFLLFSRLSGSTRIQRCFSGWFDRYGTKAALVFICASVLGAAYYLVHLSPEFPVLSYNKGIQYFTNEDYVKARQYFEEVVERYPQTLIVDQAAYHHAMCFFREKEWEKTINSLERLLETYPETGRAAEALYHMGICYQNLGRVGDAREQFTRTAEAFPGKVWAGFARDRLKEVHSR